MRKLGSVEILQLISDNHLCPSCLLGHGPAHSCKLVFSNGDSKVCEIGCKLNGLPVNKYACKHSDNTPSISVSRVISDRSIPLVENVPLGALTLGVQYDTGCQLSLISKSALLTIPTCMYSRGSSSRVRVMTYAGEGKIILTTEIKLKINGRTLKLPPLKKI